MTCTGAGRLSTARLRLENTTLAHVKSLQILRSMSSLAKNCDKRNISQGESMFAFAAPRGTHTNFCISAHKLMLEWNKHLESFTGLFKYLVLQIILEISTLHILNTTTANNNNDVWTQSMEFYTDENNFAAIQKASSGRTNNYTQLGRPKAPNAYNDNLIIN